MNYQHFRTFLWLRWRLGMNQLRKAGIANLVILLIFAAGAVLLSGIMFVAALLVGIIVLPEAAPAVLMYIWDGIIIAFLFFWLTGLLIELQRAEILSLDKFLHLPVSLTSAFLINYLGSLVTLGMVVFLPAMVGLCIALVIAKGPAMLLLFPLLAAFLLMVTALTHQFRGWLAALMANKRRRRTVVALVTVGIILLVQLPNLINIIQPWKRGQQDEGKHLQEELTELDRAFGAAQIDKGEYQQKHEAILDKREAARRERLQAAEETAGVINMVLPPGWLPYGAMAAARGSLLPSVLGTLGMALIGSVSLRRSYRTTLRLYTGQFTSGKARPAPVAVPAKLEKPSVLFFERQLPWLSEYTSAIALTCFRSLMRAPEAKLMLLSPVILVVIFGSMLLTQSMDPAEFVRPLIAAGGITMILFTMLQLVCNQFGFDRSGFRTFVLCAAPRRDILLGKNLAFAPVLVGLGAFVVILIQVVFPMRFEHFLACLPQILSMYLLFSLAGNWLSILLPLPIASGSLKPVNPKVVTVVIYLLFSFLFPLALAPTLLPLAIEYALESQGLLGGFPVCFVLSLFELAAIACLYRLVIRWQGNTLQAREQRILEIVAAKAE